MKKIKSLLLCLALLLTMAVPVSAEETTSTETGTPDVTEHVHSWTETDTATCEQDGSITRACTCGASETVGSSPAKGHSWTETVEKKATCTDDGILKKTCSRCSSVQTVTLDRLSASRTHTWGQTTVTKKPTCKEPGTSQKACTICEVTEVTALAALTTHTYDSACDEDCNVCGVERTVSHTFTTTWSKDYKGHWNECTKCGERKNEARHIPGDLATETTDQVCTVCGYVIEAKKPHTHSYGSEWTSDEVGHWHACTSCDEEKDYASHRFDDDCDADCSTCGYKRENSHLYNDDQWQSSNFDHWNVCTVCGEDSKREKHIPGEEATDKTPQLCTVCGFELAPMLEHEHDFGNTWHQDGQNHWQECSCGELSVPAAHVWDSGKENRNDTITYTCRTCGAEKTEAAPVGFNWLLAVLILLAVSCLGGIGFLVYRLKMGVFDDTEEDEEVLPEDFEEAKPQDEEDKMIDDYFASLDKELFQ